MPLFWVALIGALLFQGPGDRVTLVAGGADAAGPAKLVTPFGVEADTGGGLIFVELSGNRVGRIGPDGKVTTLAGTGKKGDEGDGGQAIAACFNGPHNLARSQSGDLYVADTWNQKVRRIDAKTGIITTVAGTGKKGFAGDGGLATKAEFGGIYCVCLDSRGESLYCADLDNRRIRKIDLKSGIVSTVAGNGKKGTPADGMLAVDQPLVDPRAVAVDERGEIYILERGGHALRVVRTDGTIHNLVGTGKPGLSGDGGPGKVAQLNGPKHLWIEADGNVLIADTENHVIRRFQPGDGTIHRVVGSGRKGSAGIGGPAREAQLNQPHGVYVSPDGAMYICDSSNHRILKLSR